MEGKNVNQIMLLTKDTNTIWRKKKVIFYYAAELSVTSSANTQSRWKKKKIYYLHDHKHWLDCFNSNITDIIYIIGISLALSLLLTPRFLIHFYWLF